MPGYQRFVTYMFRYENGKKMENCGFAKVEVRQQECRIQIQLKGITADKTEVYLLNDNIADFYRRPSTSINKGRIIYYPVIAGDTLIISINNISVGIAKIDQIRLFTSGQLAFC